MSKGLKIAFTISLCCFFLGIMVVGGCIFAVHAMGETLFWPDEDYEYTARSMSLETVRKIDLTLVGESVVLQIGGEEPSLEWSQSWDGQYVMRQNSSGDLTFSREETEGKRWGIFWKRGFHFDFSGLRSLLNGELWNSLSGEGAGRTVTLTLPEDHPALESLTLDAVSGTLTADGIAIDTIKADGANIRVELTDCEIDHLDVDTVNGAVRLTDGEARKIEVDGLNAEMTADGTTGLENVSMEGVNVRLEGNLPGESADYRFSSKGLSARMTVNGDTVKGERTVGNGDKRISVDGLNARLDVTFG